MNYFIEIFLPIIMYVVGILSIKLSSIVLHLISFRVVNLLFLLDYEKFMKLIQRFSVDTIWSMRIHWEVLAFFVLSGFYCEMIIWIIIVYTASWRIIMRISIIYLIKVKCTFILYKLFTWICMKILKIWSNITEIIHILLIN